MNDVASLIRRITPEIQNLVDLEFTKTGGYPDAGSALDQVSLKGGDLIVYDYLDFGEAGVAFDHLTYMIDETGIELTKNQILLVADIQRKLSELRK